MNSDSTSIQSEYRLLQEVLICPADSAFGSQNKLRSQWRDLNYLAEPDFVRARSEYTEFRTMLKDEGISIREFKEVSNLSLDTLYCRDASIATDHGMIICRMGKSQRMPEADIHESYYKKNHIPILGRIEAPGTLEGGDVAWLDQNTLAVGHGYRTNEEGIRQLKELLNPHGIEVVVADLPHYRGAADVFHLMSIFSPVDKNLAVVYSPLMPVRFRNYLLDRAYELIEVPAEEFDTMGCNVLAIAPRRCLMVDGNPQTEEAMRKAGCEILSYKGQEISTKGGGGPTCLTRPLSREHN